MARSNKRALLIHLITEENWICVLVFTRTKHGANKLTEELAAEGISTAALHSDKRQSLKTHTLAEFKSSDHRLAKQNPKVPENAWDRYQPPDPAKEKLRNIKKEALTLRPHQPFFQSENFLATFSSFDMFLVLFTSSRSI